MTRPRVVLGVSGGIAAYKACELLRRFTESGHDVTVIPTAAALEFVGTPEKYDEALQNFRVVLLLVDLHHQTLGGAASHDLVKKLRASAKNKGAYAMAWGAHTEVDLLKGAERAGFDKVLARSAFVREMPEIVRRAVSRIRTA